MSQYLRLILTLFRYENGITLSGLLFFHRISDNRMAGSPLRLLEIFKNLCGTHALVNVILVTSMWDDVSEEDGTIRETELCNKYWKTMIAAGSRTARFLNSHESGNDIISRIELGSRLPVLLQKELVDEKKTLAETAAAASLVKWLVEILESIRKICDSIRRNLKRKNRRQKREVLSQTLLENERKLDAVNKLIYQYTPAPRSRISRISYSDDHVPLPDSSTIQLQLKRSRNEQALTETLSSLKIIERLAKLVQVSGVGNIIGLVLTITEAVEVRNIFSVNFAQ